MTTGMQLSGEFEHFSYTIKRVLLDKEYFLVDYSSACSKDEQQEVISYYLSKMDDTPQLAHWFDLGFKNVPEDIEILKVYSRDEYNGTYKRAWCHANVKWDSIVVDAVIEWHLHDGCSDYCQDECWLHIN